MSRIKLFTYLGDAFSIRELEIFKTYIFFCYSFQIVLPSYASLPDIR